MNTRNDHCKLASGWQGMLLAALLALPLGASAQTRYEINFDNTELTEVISSVGRITGRTFIIDPRVQGKVNLSSTEALSADEVYAVFLSQLRTQGIAAVDLGSGKTKLLPDQAARLEPLPVESQGMSATAAGEQMLTRVYELRGADSAELMATLKPLIDPQVGVITPVPSSNRLVVTDWRSNLNRIDALLAQLDRPGNPDVTSEVIYLQHANASEVVEVLNKLDMGAAERDAAATVSSVSVRQSVRLEADEGTNAIVLVGAEEDLLAYKRIIDRLDIRRAQVVVETIIAEISDSRASQLGVQWLFWDGSGGNVPLAGTNFSNTTSLNAIGAAAASGDDASLGELLGGLEGLTAGVGRIGSGFSFAALLNALQTESGFNLLSTPTLLTLDNAEASILVGQEVPFVTGSVTQNNANPYQTIERKDVGIKLTLKPQISAGNSVRLDIVQEVSSISDDASASDVVTNKREIRTSAMVDDQGMVVLGGLISDERQNSQQKVPLLGDLPGVGPLFRSDGESHAKQHLLVFIRPKIVRDPAQLEQLSQQKYRDIHKELKQQRERRGEAEEESQDLAWRQLFPSSRARLEGWM
ncbi:secretin N-terminal domain-containing protein [Marinobacterium lutimaris]|uniref:General secretion pathway protein D n=1 Tax=Marinobacterium lutimaris TaxID=568106 RepID=A0A1H6DFV3_9GAMM|nr:secretin N-terminal domain-containing protein [Marinobacterium lutimaris]SEG84071.1 general secretion pathway protein D [Marinobacterium lutimaris]